MLSGLCSKAEGRELPAGGTEQGDLSGEGGVMGGGVGGSSPGQTWWGGACRPREREWIVPEMQGVHGNIAGQAGA